MTRVTIGGLRRYAIGRSVFLPGTLSEAVDLMGFVQADPIRSPARAQDLVLRHRVAGYRAGELERSYASLRIEEDVFVNYGFVTEAVHRLMHPRAGSVRAPWSRSQGKRADAILAFVRARGAVHPREVDSHFAHGRVTNYWGGSSNATTHLLDLMHYRGLLRVVRRDGGVRVYGVQQVIEPAGDRADRAARIDALVDVAVRKYAPRPGPSLGTLVARLRYAVPQWRQQLKPALLRARQRLAHDSAGGVEWYWPAEEQMDAAAPADAVHLLAPFDPIVWDRRRFELLWGWAYRFEAYTPANRRTRGYYALPLLWRDRVIGWGNISLNDGVVTPDLGYVAGRAPRERAFKQALEAELERLRLFLGEA